MEEGTEEVGQGTMETGGETENVAEGTGAPEESGGNGINPAWNPLLEQMPSSLHSILTPHLSTWDKNFQTKINEVHSKYEPYKAYLEQQIAPEQINYGLQLSQAIETRPMEVIQAITEFAKQSNLWVDPTPVASDESGQGQIDESGIPESDILNHPKFQELKGIVDNLAQIVVGQRNAEEEAKQDKELHDELTALVEKHGEYDTDWVITKALQDMNAGKDIESMEPYVLAYKEFEKGLASKLNRPAPNVLPSGGIAPGNQMDAKKLTDRERRDLVQQRLAAAAQNSQ